MARVVALDMAGAVEPVAALEPEDNMNDRRWRESRSRMPPPDTPPPSVPGDDSGDYDAPRRRPDDISLTTVQLLRDELERREQKDRDRRTRRKALEEAERARIAEEEEEAKKEEEQRKKTRYLLINGLLAALTTAVTAFGTYFATRPPAQPVEEAAKAKEEAEKAKEDFVEDAKTATATDKEQNVRIEQLGLQAVDEAVLKVDSQDYNTRMLKAISPRAAKEKEPESLKKAREQANKIKQHRQEAKDRGAKYDPFNDLPQPE